MIKALAQLPNGGLTKADFLGDLFIIQALCKEQDRLGYGEPALGASWDGGSARSELAAPEMVRTMASVGRPEGMPKDDKPTKGGKLFT